MKVHRFYGANIAAEAKSNRFLKIFVAYFGILLEPFGHLIIITMALLLQLQPFN